MAIGSLVVSVLAFIFSAYAVVTGARLQRRQTRKIDREEAERQKADVRVKLARDYTGPHFLITNQGRGAAYDVAFSLDIEKGKASPLVHGDYDAKLPITTLLVSQEIYHLTSRGGPSEPAPCIRLNHTIARDAS